MPFPQGILNLSTTEQHLLRKGNLKRHQIERLRMPYKFASFPGVVMAWVATMIPTFHITVSRNF